MNTQIKTEEQAQNEFWFLYKAANGFVALFFLIAILNNHTVVGFLGLVVQGLFNFVRVPLLIAKFEDRIKKVAFKTQIENLYVCSISPDQEEDQVVQTFKRTVELLGQSGNVHEVRVHLLIYRDTKVFTWFFDRSGRLVKTDSWRNEGSTFESWEEYLQFVEEFKRTDRDKRLRELRKDNAGFDWVNENLFYQWSEKDKA